MKKSSIEKLQTKHKKIKLNILPIIVCISKYLDILFVFIQL